ncbi:MAG TPA: hypothetical protein VGL91_22765 [Acidobacteriota bacterium]
MRMLAMSAPIKAKITPDAASSAPIDQDEAFDAFSDSDAAPTGSNQGVRTLHEPPDIWDVVHETRAEFDPRAAFSARVTSTKPVVLTVLALIVAGGALFGFIKLRGSSGNVSAVPAVRPEDSNKKTAPGSPATIPANTAASSDQPGPNTPGSSVAGSSVELNNTSATNNGVPNPGAGSNVAAQEAFSVKPVVRKARQANPARSITAVSATLASADNRDKAQQSTTPTPKSDNDKDPAATAAKKESNKGPGPGLIAPAKTAPTPKAKVIQWP